MIYCVEDDANIRELVAYTLQTMGFEAKEIEDGKALKKALAVELPELILLDIMLPGEDGLTLLKQLKADTLTRNIPVIMVTAKGAEYDKVIGLDLGADDYVSKPFGMMELISRVKALLRRTQSAAEETKICHGEIRMDNDKHAVFVGDEPCELTFKEYELLKYLMINAGIVLSRDKIMDQVWGFEYEGESRTVDMHIKTLRQKLGAAGSCIKTIRNVGYMIE